MRNNREDQLLMLCSRRYVEVVIICLMLLCMPERASALQVDPYTHYTLGGGVVFEYERRKVDSGDYQESSSIFTQHYVLNLTGYIWDPRFLIFDTFFSYEDMDAANDNGRTTKSSYTSSYYGFDSTLMRRSRLPVSFFASRNETNGVVGSRLSNRVQDAYGFRLNWRFRFRRLPDVRLDYTNEWKVSKNIVAEETDEDTHHSSLVVNFNEKFILWRSVNEANYEILRRREDDSLKDTVTGRDAHVVTVKSNVKYSSATELDLGASWYKQSLLGTAVSDQEGKGISLGLVSKALETFRQDHSYFYADAKISTDDVDDAAMTNQGYRGRLDYTPQRWLRLSQSLSLSQSDRESQSASSDRNQFTSNTSLTYLITEHLSTSEAVNHRRSENNTGDLVSGIKEQQRTEYTSSLDYNRQLFKASFATGYSVGYFEESVTYVEDVDAIVPELANGDGLIQRAHIGLAGIRLKLVTLGASYNISDQQGRDETREEPELDRTTRSYHLSASTMSNRFLTLHADYRNTETDSFVNRENEDVTTKTMRATSRPVRGASLTAHYREEDRISFNTGHIRRKDYNATALYARRVLRGRLQVSASYNAMDSESALSTSEEITIRYGAGYRTRLTSNLTLSAQADREERRHRSKLFRELVVSNDDTRIRDSIEIKAPYRLRAWFLTTNYIYIGEEHSFSSDRRNDHRLIFTLSRSFVRFF